MQIFKIQPDDISLQFMYIFVREVLKTGSLNIVSFQNRVDTTHIMVDTVTVVVFHTNAKKLYQCHFYFV